MLQAAKGSKDRLEKIKAVFSALLNNVQIKSESNIEQAADNCKVSCRGCGGIVLIPAASRGSRQLFFYKVSLHKLRLKFA